MSLTVIIPTYNGTQFLSEALASIAAQTRLPDAVLVVDDCSKDGTVELAQDIAQTHPCPVTVIRLPENSGGPSTPISVGVQSATTELVAVLDQDDVYAPDCLQHAIQALALNPEAVIAFHWAGYFDKPEFGPVQRQEVQDGLLSIGTIHGEYREIPGFQLLQGFLGWGNFVIGYPGFVFRRSVWLRKGGMDLSLKIAGDMELLGWFFRQGPSMLFPQIGYYRRLHSDNATRNKSRMNMEIAIVTCRLLREVPELGRDVQLVRKFIRTAMSKAYWGRDWDAYHFLAQYVRDYPDIDCPSFLRKRWPAFFYSIKDGLDRVLARSSVLDRKIEKQ